MKKDGGEKKELDEEYDTYDDLMFVDPRCPNLGARIIMQKDGVCSNNKKIVNYFKDEFEFESEEGQKLAEMDEKVYNRFRLMHGICQVSRFFQ